MATADTSTLSAVLQNVYLPGIKQWFNQNRPLWNRVEKITDRKKFRGSQFVFAATDGHGQGIGARAEGDSLPTPGTESLVNMTLGMKAHYATIRLSKQLMSQSGSSDGSFEDALDLHVNGAKDELNHDLAWHSVYGTGHGDLGQVSSYTGTSLVFKTQPTTVGATGTRYVRKGMVVDSYTALSGGSKNADSIAISAVTGSTATATVAGSAGFVAADYVFREDSRGNVTMGLGGIVDDGTRVTTFQNLSRTTYPLLKANVLGNSGTLRAWTPELMDQCASEAWNNGNGGWPTCFYSPLEIQQRAAAYIRNDRRVDMKVMSLDNGYQTVGWTTPDGAKPWIVDQFCRPNEVQALNEKELFFAVLEDLQWETGDGSMFRITDRSHAFEAWLFCMRNFGAYSCNSHTALRDVSHTL